MWYEAGEIKCNLADIWVHKCQQLEKYYAVVVYDIHFRMWDMKRVFTCSTEI